MICLQCLESKLLDHRKCDVKVILEQKFSKITELSENSMCTVAIDLYSI